MQKQNVYTLKADRRLRGNGTSCLLVNRGNVRVYRAAGHMSVILQEPALSVEFDVHTVG